MTYISAALRREVEKRANYKCEYCLLPNGVSFFPHEIDHVIAQKHEGNTDVDNLAFVCWRCNRYKGSDLGSFDPLSRDFSFLFNPRKQNWNKHFKLDNLSVIGLTPEGRTTVKLLQLNNNERIAERQVIR